ncbi:MAG: hypothetical protein CSA72_01000 [Rhodobacterales bacterium]|nr:MAG: hypothetical protein CSA72_01000 [Rhodobacterales bacterium]
MKVVRHHPAQLILAERPLVWAAFGFFGTMAFATAAVLTFGEGVFVSLALAAGAIFWALISSLIIQRVQVIFNRETGKVRLRRRSAWSYQEQILPLAEVASVLRVGDRSDGTTVYRYELVMTDGRQLPIEESFTNVGRPQSVADTVNAWLDSRGPAA